MREDGKFIVNGDIPEGQGSVTALLSECFELAYELRTDAEAEDADDDDDENHDDDDEDGEDADADEYDEEEEGMSLARTVSRKPGAGPPAGVSIGVK